MGCRVVGAAVAVVIGLAAAAGCGADGPASSGPTSAGSLSRNATTARPLASTRGAARAGCDQITSTGSGSIGNMASARVVTALARSPSLSQFTRAIKMAGLAGSLNDAAAITVFAPDNSAFAALGRGNLTTLMGDKSDLTMMLRDHVVSGRRAPADLASGRHLTTLRGTVIVPAKSRASYRVNNAGVVCANIQTANATVYIVNKVLVPIP